MAENDNGGFGFKLPTLGEQKPDESLDQLQKLEGIQVPDVTAETNVDQDRLVKVWKLSESCNFLTLGLKDIKRDLRLIPPGYCCRDQIVEVPLSEARAKGYTLVAGDEKWAP